MRRMRTGFVWLSAAVLLGAVTGAHADDAFYKGKRLTILINFAAGGPTDIEGRLFAKHLARHIDGTPGIVVQNMDGAGGVVGAKYLGEVAPRDGTMAGYFTGAAFIYALDPGRFRVDYKTYEFVATQPGTTVHFVRTDVPPGMREPADIAKAKGLVLGGLSVDTPKDIRLRLAMDMLGVPYKYVTGYRSSPPARLAFQRGEINFFSESPPSYRSVVEPTLVKTGQAIPVFYDAGFDGKDFFVPEGIHGSGDAELPRTVPADQRHHAVRQTLGSLQGDHQCRRHHAAHDRDAAWRAAGGGRFAAHRDRARQCRQGLHRRRREGIRLRAVVAGLGRYVSDRDDGAEHQA